jgi:glycosyltransferase involved in cell wall biosynthesis
VARRAAVVIVCSDLDRHRLAQPNVVVIPNGFVEPSRPVGRITVGDPPTVLLQGFLRYRPNIEAARELVRIITPRVRERIPLLQVRLVGAGGLETVGDLHDPPRTVVAGWVDDLGKELERSDLVAVPLRLGSGTRIKILEALAHRIPVVSTPIGAEGLELEDGRHLLLADAPEAFADSCVRALTDLDLRHQLVEEGQRQFLAHYRWSAIRPRITDLASAVAAGRRAE